MYDVTSKNLESGVGAARIERETCRVSTPTPGVPRLRSPPRSRTSYLNVAQRSGSPALRGLRHLCLTVSWPVTRHEVILSGVLLRVNLADRDPRVDDVVRLSRHLTADDEYDEFIP